MQEGHVSRKDRRKLRQLLLIAAMGGALIALPNVASAQVTQQTITGTPAGSQVIVNNVGEPTGIDVGFDPTASVVGAVSITGTGAINYHADNAANTINTGLADALTVIANDNPIVGPVVTPGSISITTKGDIASELTGIVAVNHGSGNIDITTTDATIYGDTNNAGATGLAINSLIDNATSTGDITITTDNVYANGGGGLLTTGINSVIAAANNGTGDINITVNGDARTVTYADTTDPTAGFTGRGTAYAGISALINNANSTGDINITVQGNGIVDGIDDAINARNNGTGNINIDTTASTVNGDLDGVLGSGIDARIGNITSSGDITIITGDVTSNGDAAVYGYNPGKGGISITTNGDISNNGGFATIWAENAIPPAFDGTYNGSISVTANGDVTNAGGGNGIDVYNEHLGLDTDATRSSTTVTTSGNVTAGGSGIRVWNADDIGAVGTHTDINITSNAGSVTGGTYGIFAQNDGRYDSNTTINTVGAAVSGAALEGIKAINWNTLNDGDITITTDAVTGGESGIWAINNGRGNTTITTNGVVESTSAGGATGAIWVDAGSWGAGDGDYYGNVTINANDDVIANGGFGIHVYNEHNYGASSPGSVTNSGTYITTTGDVTSVGNTAIYVWNANDLTGTTDIEIDAQGDVSAGLNGIEAINDGRGDSDTTITAGNVTSTGVGAGANGIVAQNRVGGTGDVTIHTTGIVQTDGWDGINALNNSTGNIDITTDDTVIGWGNTGITAVQNGSDATNGRIIITTHGDVTGDNAQPGLSPVNGANPSFNHDGVGYGIYAVNNNTLVAAGDDAINITADPTTTIEGNQGVFAQTNSGDITVDIGSATGLAYGIHTNNNNAADAQQGASNVIVRGDVDGGLAGIYQWTWGDANTTIESGGTVSNSDGLSTSNAILYDGMDNYTNHLTIADGGLLTGNVISGLQGQDIIDNSGTWNNAGGTSILDFGTDSQFNNYAGGSYLAANQVGAVTTTLTNAETVNDLGGDFVMQNRDERITGDPASNDPLDPAYSTYSAYVGDVISMPQSTFVTGAGNLLVDTDIATGQSDELHVANVTLGQVLSDPGDPGSALVNAPTFVNVNVTDGLGQPTAPYNNGDGILIANVSGTSDADAFQLSNELRGGLYSYSLQQGANDFVNNGTQSWYLQAGFNAEALAAGSASVMGSRSALASLSNLHDRQRDVETLSDSSESRKGVWGRVFGQGNDFESEVSDGSGTSAVSGFESDLWGVQAGLDFLAKGDEAGNRKYAGLYLAYADSSGHYTNDGVRLGKMDMNTTSVGLYYTKHTDANWYLDLVAQYSHLGSGKIQSPDNDLNTGGNSYALSLEVGKQFNPEGSIISEVQAQLIDQYTDMDDVTLNDGTRLAVSSTNAVTGRFGVRLYGNPREEGKSFLPWLRANIWHTFSTSSDVSSMGNTLSTPIGGTSGELELGFSKGRAESGGWGFYGSAGYLFDLGGAEYSGWKGTLGLRKGW